MILVTPAGQRLDRSDAALGVLVELRAPWALIARALGVVPRCVRDAVYRLIALVRRRLFAPPPGACPTVPADQRGRVLP